MLQMRPLSSVIRFNQVLTQVAKLKHYATVIVLNDQMGLLGIGPNAYTLNIIINCFSHLNQIGFGLSVLGKFFNTLIHGFLLQNREADAVGILNKMMESGTCKPNVVTFGTLIKGLCMKGNNTGSIQLLKKMEEAGCKP
ncbi:hypothetical protein C1H46_029692 [Malus baccata]|uniref:Pentatricopeptide repeat-containing protein n=1 Tax=Malus baccata TaxID=106549 RepID=A0A540LE63_MALBA|nr:hypothetical protein C1H46_029692 [Malus baccata]